MDLDPPGGSTPSLAERAKSIILRPKDEWPVIERETEPSGAIFTRYALPLIAIGPVATLIGSQLFGFRFGLPITISLSLAITSFVLTIVGLFIVSWVADKLAPKFGGISSSRNAFKLVTYSMTAAWLVGIVNLVPSLAFLAILGLYSFYLFYVGVTPMMKVPAENALTYTIVTVLCVILLYLVIGMITAGVSRAVGGFGLMGGAMSEHVNDGGTIAIPGVGAIDTAKLEEASRDLEDAQNREAVAPTDLQALLPASIGSYQRTSISSSRAGPTSEAEARYEAEGKGFTLKVMDMTVMGVISGMAGAMGVESNREDADSYERVRSVDGNLVTEKWDRASNRGSFSTMFGKRFMVEAEGHAADIEELKAAITSIDMGRLSALADS